MLLPPLMQTETLQVKAQRVVNRSMVVGLLPWCKSDSQGAVARLDRPHSAIRSGVSPLVLSRSRQTQYSHFPGRFHA